MFFSFKMSRTIVILEIFIKKRILEVPFDTLWIEMWGEVNIQFKSEENISKKKFEILSFKCERFSNRYNKKSIK